MERRAVVVRGIVQGVGFRPFVYGLAVQLHLRGFVKNQTGTVFIELEGDSTALDRFLTELAEQPPPLAQIEHVSWARCLPRGDVEFRIEASEADASHEIFISPDVATCADCLRELLDPGDRRYGYPFLNCTNCGPRLTIIQGAPYDRTRTTMAGFPMCAACRAEYENPRDRRFHAQPTCCAACGPRLQGLTAAGEPVAGDACRTDFQSVLENSEKDGRIENPSYKSGSSDFLTEPSLAWFVAAIRGGQIGALKGLGGYHLVCEASNPSAVRKLRLRKHRDEKPFAVMVRDLQAAEEICDVHPGERELLVSSRRPIVLLRKRTPCLVAEEIAPGNPWLGVMLPYTPLHHLLLRAVQAPLVMTSGNRSDEPIAYQDADALERVSGIADVFLIHDRPIHVRCDDSVTRVVDGVELPMRRSRGYAPQPVALPVECPFPILAVGGQLKATFALGRDRQAFVSHHMGDLDHFDAYTAFVEDVRLYEQLFAHETRLIACDLHPDYATTGYARERAAREAGIELLAVQHHHAHMASCMAENGLDEPVIGVSFDGTGYGPDGAVWGGEFLVGDYRQFRRAAHLRYVGMPGGDQAVRQPWRMALVQIRDAAVECPSLSARILPKNALAIDKMLERGINTPRTSSAGRLFDAVAALAGVRDSVSYEGQAAIELEWMALAVEAEGAYAFEIEEKSPGGSFPHGLVIDTRPLIREIVRDIGAGIAAAHIARRFHSTLVEVVSVVCARLRKALGLGVVVLSGGVFLNTLLTSEVCSRLATEGFRVYRHCRVPPNDGGLSLGQLAVAAQWAGGEGSSSPSAERK